MVKGVKGFMLLNYPVGGGVIGDHIGGSYFSFKLPFCRYIKKI